MPRRLEEMTEPELRELMRGCADAIEMTCTTVFGIGKPHFALLLFNDPVVAQYIGNCRREDIIKSMRECADRLEAREDVTR